jgi:hypothetical protein
MRCESLASRLCFELPMEKIMRMSRAVGTSFASFHHAAAPRPGAQLSRASRRQDAGMKRTLMTFASIAAPTCMVACSSSNRSAPVPRGA